MEDRSLNAMEMGVADVRNQHYLQPGFLAKRLLLKRRLGNRLSQTMSMRQPPAYAEKGVFS